MWSAGELMPAGGFFWAFVAVGVLCALGAAIIVWSCCVVAGEADDAQDRLEASMTDANDVRPRRTL